MKTVYSMAAIEITEIASTAASGVVWVYLDNTTQDHTIMASNNVSKGILFWFDDVGARNNIFAVRIEETAAAG